MEGFSLSKAYLDVVDREGRCAISYQARLAWGPLALRWDGLSLFEPGREPMHRSAWKTGDYAASPARIGGRHKVSVLCDPVGANISCEPWCEPFAVRLLDTGAGTLEWSCDAAGADVLVQADEGVTVGGAGYAEHLELRMPPWKLPIDELRWGRWHCADTRRSVVWIDWRGERPLTLVLEDGATQDRASIEDGAIHWAGRSLCLTASRTLSSRTLAEILGGAAPLATRLPPRWRSLEDRKTLSRGTLGNESGWAIHEMVRFP